MAAFAESCADREEVPQLYLNPSESSLLGSRFVVNDDRREVLASHLLPFVSVRLGQDQQSGRSLFVGARARQPNAEVGLAMVIFGARHEAPGFPALLKRLRAGVVSSSEPDASSLC